jgi:uncharacterized protein
VAELLIVEGTTIEPPKRGPIELLVVQSTAFCNIDCRYCYLPGRSERRAMTQETVARLFKDALSSPFCGDRITIVWHAGEPLAPGIEFYEQAFATIDRLNRGRVQIAQSVQTNGILINQAWAISSAGTMCRSGSASMDRNGCTT